MASVWIVESEKKTERGMEVNVLDIENKNTAFSYRLRHFLTGKIVFLTGKKHTGKKSFSTRKIVFLTGQLNCCRI